MGANNKDLTGPGDKTIFPGMSKHTDRTATVQAAIRRARLGREINAALSVPKPMTKEEAFRGFTDEEPTSPDEARESIKDAGGF